MTDNFMNLNESQLNQMNRLNANINKTRPQDRNDYRPMPLN